MSTPETKLSPRKLFINGEWVDAASGETFETVNPATEEVQRRIGQCSSPPTASFGWASSRLMLVHGGSAPNQSQRVPFQKSVSLGPPPSCAHSIHAPTPSATPTRASTADPLTGRGRAC